MVVLHTRFFASLMIPTISLSLNFQKWTCYLTSLLSSLYHSNQFPSPIGSSLIHLSCCAFSSALCPAAGWILLKAQFKLCQFSVHSPVQNLQRSPLTMSPFTLPHYLYTLLLTYIILLQILQTSKYTVIFL